MTTLRLSHAEVTDHLTRSGVEFSASEAHGLASGLLATRAEHGHRLVSEVLPHPPEGDLLAMECRTILQRLAEETEADLMDNSFGFTPMLPGDNAPLRERAGALRDWCEGFLYGVGIGNDPSRRLPPEVTEALEDIGELTRLDISDIGESEAEEQSFFELVEFIRVATLLIRDELTPPLSPGRRENA